MLHYKNQLKSKARALRGNQTDAETLLWFHIRRKQLLHVQFYRQKPIGRYIVDFYAPAVNLVIEVDGSQHLQADHIKRDRERDFYLARLDLKVLRFNNLQVLQSINAVLEVIFCEIQGLLNPP